MQVTRKAATLILLFPVALFCAQWALAKKKPAQDQSSPADARQRALHALDRLTFGPGPGDVQRVMAVGVDKWIDEQLHPEKIDDSALDARLAQYRTLQMSSRQLVEDFPSVQTIKAVANGKQPMPSDSAEHAIYMAQMEKYEERIERKQQDASTAPAPADSAGGTPANSMTPPKSADEQQDEAEMQRRENRQEAEASADQMLDLAPEERYNTILKLPANQQLVLASIKYKTRESLLDGMTPQQRETVEALSNPQQVVMQELMDAKLERDIYSERQLQAVMEDFWFNHFNVFANKGADRYMLTSYERDVIRPHALGKFEDLLVATAQSPAMLFYLDNWLSVGPNSDVALGIQERRPPNPWRARRYPGWRPVRRVKPRESGLNENYGRELMELHTLGVNGGYTQQDVIQVARAFTGWTLKQPREGGEFYFNPRMHDPGVKIVLGHKIKPNGEKEGLEVLHILAHSPATANFICTKLAMRFVSDTPPQSLVDRMARTFLKKDGDIREVLKTMFHSSEFWAPEAERAKVKTPLEFVVSAARASGADVTDAMPLERQLQAMGMPLYGMQPPTGYSMKGDAWVNSSALLARMNFALELTANRINGTKVDAAAVLGEAQVPTDPNDVLAALENSVLNGDISKQTHDTIEARLQDPKISQRRLDDPARAPNVGIIEGLLLGSPDFQRR